MKHPKSYECSLLSSQVDWLTCTYRESLARQFLQAKVDRLMVEQEDLGHDVKDTNRLGFIGYRTDGLFAGIRDKTLMVIATGQIAAEHSQYFLTWADNISRVDLQVTLQDPEPQFDWTQQAYFEVQTDARVESGILKTHLIKGTPDGRTLYIGSRASDRFFRLYDKSAESKDPWPVRSWRWEVEYKAGRAMSVGKRFVNAEANPGRVLGTVRDAYADVKVHLPCKRVPAGFSDRSLRPKTTIESRVAYTEATVAPFLRHLADDTDATRVRVALANGGITVPQDWYNPVKGGSRE